MKKKLAVKFLILCFIMIGVTSASADTSDYLEIPEGLSYDTRDQILFLRTSTKVDVRKEAVAKLAVAKEGAKLIVPFLVEGLKKDKNKYVRVSILKVLEKTGDEQMIYTIIGSLGDKAWQVRYQAIKSLASIGDDRAIKPIEMLLEKDSAPQVQRMARMALNSMKKKSDKKGK